MNNYGIKLLGHIIPPVLHANSSSILGFRIQNTLERTVYFSNRGSFYGNEIHNNALRVNVFLNGDFFINTLVLNDRIHSGQSATIFFPFQTKDKGDYRLQIIAAEQGAKTSIDNGDMLLDVVIEVTDRSSVFDLKRSIKQGLFAFSYSELPLQLKKLQLWFYKTKLRFPHRKSSSKGTMVLQLKDINRQLAFMEKQIRKSKVASLPCYISMDTTSKCNLKCKSCFRNYIDIDFNTKPDMPDNIINRLIHELFPTAYTVNLSTIGEPLLSSHFESILNACIEYKVCLSFTTNGTLLEGNYFLKKLVSALHHIEISFDSSFPGLFEKLRTGASYDRVLQNVKNLGKIRHTLPDPKFNLGFSMTLFRENLEEIPDMLRLLSEVGGNFLKTDIGVIFSKKDLHHSVLSHPDLYNETYAIAQESAKKSGLKLLMRPPFSKNCLDEAATYGICDYLYVSACIGSEGELKPCFYQVLRNSVNVKKGFATSWNNKRMQCLRLEHNTNKCHPLCRDCYLILEGGDSVEKRRNQFLRGDARNLFDELVKCDKGDELRKNIWFRNKSGQRSKKNYNNEV